MFYGSLNHHLPPTLLGKVKTPWTTERFLEKDPKEDFARSLADADVLISMVWNKAFPPAPRLRLIQSPGTGVDFIDLTAVPPGVRVSNCYGHAEGTAGYVMLALLLWCQTSFVPSDASFRNERSWRYSGRVNGPIMGNCYLVGDTQSGKGWLIDPGDDDLWGSWLDDQVDTNAAFWLAVWSDVPRTNAAYPSHPGTLLWHRWFMPGEIGEVVPEKATISAGPFDETVRPDFPLRKWQWYNYAGFGFDDVIWARRIGMNSGDEQVGPNSGPHGLVFVDSHETMKKAHPEYYALIGGKRDTAHREHGTPCFTSEGLGRETVKYIRFLFDRYDFPSADIWPVDGLRLCQCAGCDRKSASELVCGFADQVARDVYRTHPTRRITCGAYTSYVDPRAAAWLRISTVCNSENAEDAEVRGGRGENLVKGKANPHIEARHRSCIDPFP